MIKKHAITLVGLAVMISAFAWNILVVDENVPNDANIGAGILFIFGIAVVIAGVAATWSRRTLGAPPPPGAPPTID